MRGRQYDEVITVMPKDNLEVINLNSLEAVQEMEERDEVMDNSVLRAQHFRYY